MTRIVVFTLRSQPSQAQSQSSTTRTSGGGAGARDDVDLAISAGVACGYIVSRGENEYTVTTFAGSGDGPRAGGRGGPSKESSSE